jgi:hypothetical protein
MVVWLVFVVGGEKWRFLYTCHVVTAVIGPPCYAPMCFATAKRERERERERKNEYLSSSLFSQRKVGKYLFFYSFVFILLCFTH